MPTRTFRPDPTSVGGARRFVREVLRGKPAKVTEAAELMVSELASNCVRHAKTDFQVTISSKGEIRVEVSDSGQGRPTVMSPRPQESSGRGLLIVEKMSSAWGVISSSAGKTVWFTVSQPKPDSATS
jgi:anti-sigma regulatory factor (Ser/Thr protein kinase)